MTETADSPKPSTKLYAVVELFGHQRIAGEITEQNFGGANLVRVDVPEIIVTEQTWPESAAQPIKVTRLIEAHTRSFGAGAIYSINWCDEATALAAAKSIVHEPLRAYTAKTMLAQLPEAHQARLGLDSDMDDDEPF